MKRAGFIWSESCIVLLCFPPNNCEIQRQQAWNEVQLFQTLLQWVQRELMITSLFWILNEFISGRPLWGITMRPGSAFIRFESFNEKRQPFLSSVRLQTCQDNANESKRKRKNLKRSNRIGRHWHLCVSMCLDIMPQVISQISDSELGEWVEAS